MDTSDPDIEFNDIGICNHCISFDKQSPQIWFPNDQGRRKFETIVSRIKESSKGKPFDCIMGLSGGVDSSYLALLLKEYGLNVLVVHVDGGWNSELAVSNIESIVNYCKFELHTHVVNWEAMKQLQLAYLRSGVANQDVPQDHAFFAVLHKEALKQKCRYFMSGGNVASEFIFPKSWHADAMDRINLLDIYKNHGVGKLKGFETISFWDWHLLLKLRGFVQVRPLNYFPYSVNIAISELENIGWRNYGRKHGESIFTKFFQNYLLPKRFGYDKRRPHFSSRINSGDMTRNKALELLNEPLYEKSELKVDMQFVCKKLGIDQNELKSIISAPQRNYREYKNWDRKSKLFFNVLKNVKSIIGRY